MNIQPSRLQTCTCPTCGGYLGEAAPLEAVREKVRMGHQLVILDKLSRRVGRLVSSDDLVNAMYADRPDGGPDGALQTLQTNVCRLKAQVELFGWTIVSTGRPSCYKLVPFASSPADLYREVKVKKGAK